MDEYEIIALGWRVILRVRECYCGWFAKAWAVPTCARDLPVEGVACATERRKADAVVECISNLRALCGLSTEVADLIYSLFATKTLKPDVWHDGLESVLPWDDAVYKFHSGEPPKDEFVCLAFNKCGRKAAVALKVALRVVVVLESHTTATSGYDALSDAWLLANQFAMEQRAEAKIYTAMLPWRMPKG